MKKFFRTKSMRMLQAAYLFLYNFHASTFFTLASTGTKSDSTRSAISIQSQKSITSSSNPSTTNVPPRNKALLNRHDSEGSCLSELKETIEKDGDLAKTVVRIEVSFFHG
jgi:hypothetical protein